VKLIIYLGVVSSLRMSGDISYVYSEVYHTSQCFSTFVRPRPGKFFIHKTRAQSQQIHSSVTFHFLSSYIKLT